MIVDIMPFFLLWNSECDSFHVPHTVYIFLGQYSKKFPYFSLSQLINKSSINNSQRTNNQPANSINELKFLLSLYDGLVYGKIGPNLLNEISLS